MLKKKLSKLVLTEADLIMEEESELLTALETATSNLHHATWAFANALDKLNTVNARLNRGPVEIEDELFHHCPAQETFNQRYATENARYQAKLAQRLQKITANEQQK